VLPLALDSYVTEWLNLLLRGLPLIAGIAWIGASFYFIALDNHLHAPREERDAEKGVGGEAWEVHGGGFYHVQKYKVAPPKLPEPLLWFKWEAYTTWLSGFALLVILYYANADSYLIDRSVADLSTAAAIGASVGILVAGWVVYDVLCRQLERSELVLAAVVLGCTIGLAYGAESLFSPRGAYIQVGATLGTIMAGNVFFVIIPAQWELVRAKKAGREPDPAPGLEAKQRSVHNNYLTLPVVFTMISNHFPATYGHDFAWAVLIAIMLIGAWVRHYFNLRHTGKHVWAIPASAAVAIALVAVWVRPDSPEAAAVPAQTQTGGATEAGKAVFASAGCGSCHVLADAGSTGTIGPNLDGAKPSRELVIDRVENGQGAMPSFKNQLSTDEIEALADYVASVAGK
jgi:uncharacterized membrane protein